MADAPKPDQLEPEYPNSAFPVFFADATSNALWGRGIVKWYFTREHPPLNTTGATQNVPAAQVVMPAEGFVAMSFFFDQVREALVRDGAVTPDFMARLAAARDSQ
jgi:hypothetical protein